MENKYCKSLFNSLSFHQKNVRYCTTLQLGEIISKYEETPKELALKILESRKEIFENLNNNNIIPQGCQDCIYKDESKYINSDKIERIDLYYWYHCNCGCFYCSYRDETKGEFSDKEKEGNPLIFGTLKELYKLDAISKDNLHVCWGGGEIGVLKEFPKIIDLFLKNNVKNIWCESSGIKYSKALEKVLKQGKGGLTIAVCSGSKETYKKIKKRDKYKQVVNNLKKYVNAANKYKADPNNKCNIVSKYIILKGFNDNKTEIEKWLSECKKIGLRNVEISMEFCWGIHTKKGQKVEDYNYELFDYAEKKVAEYGLELKKNPTSMELMEKGIY